MLTLADVARLPRPGMSGPGSFAFSPDGACLTFLRSPAGDLARELWSLDLATGVETRLLSLGEVGEGVSEASVSIEEELRRERERRLEGGITGYEWAERAPVLLVPVQGDLWVRAGAGAGDVGGAWRVVARGASAARLCGDGSAVVFVRDGDLWWVPVAGGEARRLTDLALPGVTCGLAEFIAAEEMGRRDGFWIAPAGDPIAFAEVDERHIPELAIPHLDGAPSASETHRYPFAGAANARVRLGLVAGAGGDPRWLDLAGAEYLARVDWSADGGALLVQLQPRDQRRLELRAYDPVTGGGRTWLVERSATWVNLHDDLRPLPGGEYVWASERTGFKHLYLYREDRLLRPLTTGDWAVDAVAGVGPEHVYFTAGRPGPLERQLFRVALAGGEPERLTPEPGWHEVAIAPGGDTFVDRHDRRSQPPRVRVGDRVVHEPPPFDLAPPELLTLTAADGRTPLHAALYRPQATGPAPLVVAVYGGPHVQIVQESWALTVALRARHLAERGFAVLMLDNRGSARRGVEFESAIAGRLGRVEVDDQVAGVRHLVGLGVADPARVGIVGWSYGGYLVLRCLALAPEVFHVGVAGAPNVELEGYDTHWTERYLLGGPRDNPDGYRESSALGTAERIRGRLLLVHGMRDENVLFRHSVRLVQALVRAGVEHEVLLLPQARHSVRDERDRLHLETRIAGFLSRHLAAPAVVPVAR